MIARVACLATVGGLFAALPAAAASFTPPKGCALEMTVQMHGCQVANHYRCEADPAGYRNIAYADGSGVFYISKLDDETRWILSYATESGEIDRLDQDGSADHASFSALIAEGRDDYDFVTRNNFGEVRRHVGYDLLSGGSVTIDGVVLERSEFDLRTEDEAGNFIAHRKGQQLISRELRLFFADTEQFENAYGDKASTMQSPVTFAFPGEEGFGEAKPKYDCDMLMTGASPLTDRPTL